MRSLEELVRKLHEIKNMGYVKSQRTYSTGIGYTLETLLGISENRSRAPDWGIYELKTKRKGKKNNSSLYVPKWNFVNYTHWRDVVKERGEPYKSKDGNKRGKALLHAAPYGKPEKHGWRIRFNKSGDLFLIHKNKTIAISKYEDLIENFSEKFEKIVWIEADYRFDSKNIEEFHYTTAYLLENSTYEKFVKLVKDNKIVLELRLYYFSKHPKDKIYESHGNAFRSKDGVIFKLFNKKKRIL